mgnify:CR=1 FL=1
MYKFETETSKDGVIEKVLNHQPEGYKPSTGIYTSSYIFQGNWENELEALNFTRRGNTIKKWMNINAKPSFDFKFKFVHFKYCPPYIF